MIPVVGAWVWTTALAAVCMQEKEYHGNGMTGYEKDKVYPLTLNSSNAELSSTKELAAAPTLE